MKTPVDVTGPLRVSALPKTRRLDFSWVASPEIVDRLTRSLDLQDLRKLRLTGHLIQDGRTDWRLKARLGATAVQSCVATQAPVVTRIDTDLERVYVADWAAHVPSVPEAEMPEDDRYEPLGDDIDLEQLVLESLALALPDFPRSAEAELVSASALPPGAAPIEDADTRPFAALADLKRKLEDQG